jgi:hypothetical protein
VNRLPKGAVSFCIMARIARCAARGAEGVGWRRDALAERGGGLEGGLTQHHDLDLRLGGCVGGEGLEGVDEGLVFKFEAERGEGAGGGALLEPEGVFEGAVGVGGGGVGAGEGGGEGEAEGGGDEGGGGEEAVGAETLVGGAVACCANRGAIMRPRASAWERTQSRSPHAWR